MTLVAMKTIRGDYQLSCDMCGLWYKRVATWIEAEYYEEQVDCPDHY